MRKELVKKISYTIVLIKSIEQLKYLIHITKNINNIMFASGKRLEDIRFWYDYKENTYIRFNNLGEMYYGYIGTLNELCLRQYAIFDNVESFIASIPKNNIIKFYEEKIEI